MFSTNATIVVFGLCLSLAFVEYYTLCAFLQGSKLSRSLCQKKGNRLKTEKKKKNRYATSWEYY